MAKKPVRRGRTGDAAQKKKAKRDPGSDTNADSRLVNAMESDPQFFKDPLVGKTLGKCQIGKCLGEGKTGVVYRATYEPLNRTVAVKVLQTHMTKVPAVVRVFQQEGRAVAALDHENVLKIYDVGEDRGQHYLVLELLHGRDLLEHIERAEGGTLDVETALDYTRQAAAGLAAAHRKNLVHRDIKPQNLVVEPNGTLKIVDFGLAAEAEGAFAGGRLGTPHYMSPEQCRGESAVTASDIYSLGFTLFHMLVGQPPFKGLPSTDEIIAEHLKGKRLEPDKLRPGIPRPVGELVRKMTRMDASARPSAKEIVETIDKLTPDRLARGAAGATTRRRAPRRQSSAPSPLLLIGGGVVALLVILFMVTRGGDERPAGDDPSGDPSTADTTPNEPPPKKAARKPVVVERSVEEKLRKLLAEARAEEKTGNLQEALRIYIQAKVLAPAGSKYFKEADESAMMLNDHITVEKGTRKKRTRRFVPVSVSEESGRQYQERQPEFRKLMRSFQLATVRKALGELIDRTRDATPERGAIELGLKRLGYLEALLEVFTTRVEGMPASNARWSLYEFGATVEQTVLAIGPAGVTLRSEDTDAESVKPWEEIPASTLVPFLDALRNKSSASECLALGYFCQLLDDPAADTYFDYALQLDSGSGMGDEIRALRGEG